LQRQLPSRPPPLPPLLPPWLLRRALRGLPNAKITPPRPLPYQEAKPELLLWWPRRPKSPRRPAAPVSAPEPVLV
jgi:hypothetical protein